MFDRFGQVAFEPLPLERLGLIPKFKRLAAVQEEAATLIARYWAADRDVRTLEAGRSDARDKDLEAGARALRAGKEAPEGHTPTHESALDKDLTTVTRTRDVLERAVTDVIAEAMALKQKNAAALTREMDAAIRSRAASLAEHARQAARLYAEVEDAERDVRRLIPPPPAASLENVPAGPTRVIFAPLTRGVASPTRGDIERILAYLTSLGAPESPGEADGESRVA
ncbi:MAG: hypothetical protein WKF53_12385 [Rubrobacter sp.]